MKIEHYFLETKAISIEEIKYMISKIENDRKNENCYIYVSYVYNAWENFQTLAISSLIFEKGEDERREAGKYLENFYEQPDFEANEEIYLDERLIVEKFYKKNCG